MKRPTLDECLDLIETMKALIEDAMYTHIYDESNGEEPDEDCAYQKAVDDATALLERAS